MKAIIIARVSTEDQREANNSLPAQISRMESYCKRNEYPIIETFSFDESAYKTKRDEFDKIIDCINNTKEKIAVCLDQERLHLVFKIFEMYASGNYSYASIREEVTRQGLRTLEGNILSKSNIENVIKDSFYCGIAVSKKYGPYTHKYPRLITRELFDKCQEIREGRYRKLQKFLSKEFVFKGLLTCRNCGCSMTPEIKTKPSGLTFTYYSCTNAKGICQRIYVPEKTLLKPIYSVLDRFESITEEAQNELVEELRKDTEAEVAFHKAQINRIRDEYTQLKQRGDRLLEAYLELLRISMTRNIKTITTRYNSQTLNLKNIQKPIMTIKPL